MRFLRHMEHVDLFRDLASHRACAKPAAVPVAFRPSPRCRNGPQTRGRPDQDRRHPAGAAVHPLRRRPSERSPQCDRAGDPGRPARLGHDLRSGDGSTGRVHRADLGRSGTAHGVRKAEHVAKLVRHHVAGDVRVEAFDPSEQHAETPSTIFVWLSAAAGPSRL